MLFYIYILIQILDTSFTWNCEVFYDALIPDHGCLFYSLPYAILYAFDFGFIND